MVLWTSRVECIARPPLGIDRVCATAKGGGRYSSITVAGCFIQRMVLMQWQAYGRDSDYAVLGEIGKVKDELLA